MITIKTMKQIPTARVVRSFRSGGSRQPLRRAEDNRILAGHAQMVVEETRRQWLNQMWQNRDMENH